jgi:hypothetical protein
MNEPESFNLPELVQTATAPDEQRAPDFDGLWSAASTRHRRRRQRTALLRGAVAFVLLAGSVMAFSLLTRSHRATTPSAVATAHELPWRSTILLSEWHSPTDALLPATDLRLSPY